MILGSSYHFLHLGRRWKSREHTTVGHLPSTCIVSIDYQLLQRSRQIHLRRTGRTIGRESLVRIARHMRHTIGAQLRRAIVVAGSGRCRHRRAQANRQHH